MTILVFGATSQIGHFLLPALRVRGEPVLAVSRRPSAQRAREGVCWIQGSLPDAVPEHRDISVIISFAPLLALAKWMEQAALPLAPRVIATSSMSALSKQNSPVLAERIVAQQLRDGEAALASVCARHGAAWTVLRPTLIYGAGMDKSLTPIARRAARWRIFPLLSGDGLRQPVHAEDVALAVLAALDQLASAGWILSIGGGERLSVAQMFDRVRQSLAVTSLPLPLPAWLLRFGSHVLPYLRGPLCRLDSDLLADNTQLTRLLGVQPRPFCPDARCLETAAV